MVKTRIIPSLLLKERGLVKTLKFKDAKYVGDPINAVRIFNEKEVDEIIFLDITATLENRKPDFNYIADIAHEAFMPFSYGGGIRDINDIKKLFNIGVEKIIINSFALENPFFIKEASDIWGSQSIVVSIDVKKNLFGKYEIFGNGGTRNTKLDPVKFVKKAQEMGAGEIFVNSIDRDGTMIGYDIFLLKEISEALTIPVIACGGAGKLEDFAEAVNKGGVTAVAAGSLFVFYGKHRAVLITYPTMKDLEMFLE